MLAPLLSDPAGKNVFCPHVPCRDQVMVRVSAPSCIHPLNRSVRTADEFPRPVLKSSTRDRAALHDVLRATPPHQPSAHKSSKTQANTHTHTFANTKHTQTRGPTHAHTNRSQTKTATENDRNAAFPPNVAPQHSESVATATIVTKQRHSPHDTNTQQHKESILTQPKRNQGCSLR